MKKIEAFEMWCYRKMLKINWTEHISNVEVLSRMNKELEVMSGKIEETRIFWAHFKASRKVPALEDHP